MLMNTQKPKKTFGSQKSRILGNFNFISMKFLSNKFLRCSFSEKTNMKTLRIYLSGTVQGVMFRKYIEEQANKIGVRGFVRNTPDGKVEVVIEGRDDKIFQMLEKCKAGTAHTMVRNTEIQEIKNQGFEDFRVMRL